MRRWRGTNEYGSYIFEVDERLSTVDNTLNYDLRSSLDGRTVDNLWFHTLPSLRAYLKREYGKVSLKLEKVNTESTKE